MKRNHSRIVIALSASALSVSFVFADFASGRAVAKKSDPATVLERKRFGGYIEETTLITKGPHANHIAMTNGAEIFAVPINANSDGAIKRIFDSRAVGWEVPPKGMAFIESEEAFAFVEGANPTKLYLADRTGKALPTRTITYLPEPLNDLHNEGLIYLPQSSPFYPDHILMIANRFPPVDPFIESSIEILTRDGQVVAKIIPPSPLRENYLTGISLRGTNQLLIGLNNQLWTIDFDGNLISGPVETPGPFVEGIEQLPDGRFVISAAERLYFYDAFLNRLEQDDRDAGIGHGLLLTSGVAWNSNTSQHLIPANFEETGNYFEPHTLFSVSSSLGSVNPLFEMDPAERFRMILGFDYLPAENLTAALLWRFGAAFPGAIAMYNAVGVEVDRVILPGSPQAMAYIPQTNQFAVVFRGINDHKIRRFTRQGVLVSELDLGTLGVGGIVALTPFNPGHATGGQFLVFAHRIEDGGRALIIDFEGNLLGEFNYLEALSVLNVGEAATITSGPQAGAFSVTDNLNHELVVFRLTDN